MTGPTDRIAAGPPAATPSAPASVPSGRAGESATSVASEDAVRHAPSAAPDSSPATSRRNPFARAFDYLFPPGAERRAPSGILGDNRFESIALVLSLALAAGAAVLLEFVMSQAAVPPGGDPGQWITTSYAYVGLPYPSWVIPGQYPPLTFPLLGALVRGAGPILGARLYVGLVGLLLGVATYVWARSVVQTWSVALLVEGLVLLNPSFVELFFFGAYPNLLGFVFYFLAVGFAVRFVRSRNGTHALAFWLALGAAVLTHTLVAAVLAATLLAIAIPLLALRRIPRELFTDRRSQVGFLIAAGGIAGFYGLTGLLGIPHNQYLAAGAFAYVKNGLGAIFGLLLSPAFPKLTIAATTAFELFVLIVGVILLTLVVMIAFRLRVFTLSLLVVLASVLAVCLGVVIGWQLAIVTDYVRLGYFLIPPVMLGFGLALDGAVVELRKRYAARARRRRPPEAPVTPPRWSPARPLPSSLIVLGVAVVLLVLLANGSTISRANLYESNDTTVAHTQQFLSAISLIRDSGVKGAVLTVPGAVKWSRALLDTNSYGPFIPGHYSFDPTHIVDEELAYFALTDRYAVTNNLVAFSAAGNSPAWQNATPMYQASYFGLFTPVLRLSPANITVTILNQTAQIPETVTVVPQIVLPTNGLATMSLVYTQKDFQLVVSETALPAAPYGRLSLQATATGTALLQSVKAVLTNPPVGTGSVGTGRGTGQFTWEPAAFGGALQTFGNVTPAADLKSVTNNYGQNAVGRGPQVVLSARSSSATGSPSLGFSVLLSTPGAQNLITSLPPLISTPTVWANWSARFVLYGNASIPATLDRGILPTVPQYLEQEFGAQVIGYAGIWTVLLLPAPGA